MAFKFWCECGWNSGVRSSADVGPEQVERKCDKCGDVQMEGKKYLLTDRQLASNELDCPECGKPAMFNLVSVGRSIVRNAQVGEREASAVAIHPVTGEVVYCFGDDPAKPLPEEWKKEGFEKKQFHSFKELEKFCRERGQVNDIEGDWHKDDGYFEEDLARRRKQWSEERKRYMEEREKVKAAHPELARRERDR